jgi:hypothetical protein
MRLPVASFTFGLRPNIRATPLSGGAIAEVLQ